MPQPTDGFPEGAARADLGTLAVSLTVDESLYPLDAVYGAAFAFLDRCYVVLDRPEPARLRVTLTGRLLPHGIFEIPALVLASAVVLRMGAILVTPQIGKSMGQVILELFAGWLKLFLGGIALAGSRLHPRLIRHDIHDHSGHRPDRQRQRAKRLHRAFLVLLHVLLIGERQPLHHDQ